MMHELPTDFPHEAPTGYRYRTAEFKPNVISIWCDHLNHYNFNSGATVSTIWGFVKFKTTAKRGTTHTYHAPIRSNKIGKIVALDQTSAYSAMPLLKLALDSTDDTPAPAMIDSSTKDTTMTMTTPAFYQDQAFYNSKEFSDYCAQKDAQNTNQINVTKYGLMLCDALQQSHQRSHPNGQNYSYALFSSGRKYHKVMQCVNGETESVHAFIDKKTGELYKAASFKQPAKGVRFNLLIITEREFVLENCDWAGGYLYK